MTFAALVRKGLLLSFLAMTLAACNDSGGDGEPDTKVYFRSLKGEPNKVTDAGLLGDMKNSCLGCAELGVIVNSLKEFEEAVNLTSTLYSIAYLLGDTRVDFTTNTVVEIRSFHYFGLLPTVENVQEEVDRIRIFPVLCHWSPTPDGAEKHSQTWIVIPKTAKPIVVEPMTKATGETWPNGGPGAPARCDKLAVGQVS